jgi:alpha-glucosidase
MSRKVFGLVAAVVSSVFPLSVRAEIKTFDLLPGEYWWGGTVGGGWQMPLGADRDYSKDLRIDSDGNQSAPLLLSTKGRWVWCEDAFKYTVKHGRLTVETGPAPRLSGNMPHPMDVEGPVIPERADAASAKGSQIDLIPNYEKTGYSKNTFAPIQSGTADGGILKSAFMHCSKTFFPPKGMPRREWFEQPILNTWVEFNYNQNEKDTLAYAQSFLDNGMKPGVFQIDCFWHTDNFGTWTFHGDRFRDPKGMVRKLNAMGFHVILWYAPFVTMDSMAYRLLRKNNGLLKDARRRKPYQGLPVQWWDGMSAVWDPTSPFGCAWNRNTMRRIMNDYGVEGFFFDGGGCSEFPPGDYIATDTRAQPTDLTRGIQMMALEVPFGQCREAWKMGGLPLMQTLRDKAPKWSEMRRCITDMIAAGQLGYPFTVADLVGGGTCGNSGEGIRGLDWQDELFIRHLQIECLSPMVMFSGSPWRVLSPGAQEIVRKFIALRARFAPRITALAVECGRTGIPMLRSMDFQFPNQGYELVLDQFMMGDDLLVAPVVEGGAKTRRVVVPEGTWRMDDGAIVVGPKTIEVATPLDRLPHFERVKSENQ